MTPLIQLDAVSLSLDRKVVLRDCNWAWYRGENIAVCGPNGSGKSLLAKLITDQIRPNRGTLRRSPHTAKIIWLAFDAHLHRLARDRKLDDSEFRADANDPGTTVASYLASAASHHERILEVATRLGIAHLLQRGIRYISTGETRKMLIARALLENPDGLIMDEPRAGLDRHAQTGIDAVLDELFTSPVALMLLCADDRYLPDGLRCRYHLHDGILDTSSPARGHTPDRIDVNALPAPITPYATPETLIELQHVDASFHGKPVLKDINWRLDHGQHCHISGPNGSGKTTLLELLCGANHAAYGQSVTIFGRRRGTGESVWEIKQLFGIVNTNLQWQYHPRVRCGDVIASGFHDSVGLYRDCSPRQISAVEDWLSFCGLTAYRGTRFGELSAGTQRVALIARAMVKSPPILILDEPYIGLDRENRVRIGAIIDAIAAGGRTSILFVSHDAGDEPACINQWLRLVPAACGFTAEVSTAV